jgi:hypothetical protein
MSIVHAAMHLQNQNTLIDTYTKVHYPNHLTDVLLPPDNGRGRLQSGSRWLMASSTKN